MNPLQRVAPILTCLQVDVTSANQTSLSSGPHMCIMQCGSCSLKPAVGSAKALRHRVTICLGENDPHAKESQEGGGYLGPSEAVQHLPEGLRSDLDDPGEGVVELAHGEEYAADD